MSNDKLNVDLNRCENKLKSKFEETQKLWQYTVNVPSHPPSKYTGGVVGVWTWIRLTSSRQRAQQLQRNLGRPEVV